MKNEEFTDAGPCCCCGKTGEDVRNFIMLDRRAPVPGTGWGCVVCHLPFDGALAVVCDACLTLNAPYKDVCKGYPGKKERAPYDSLQPDHFGHNMALHGRRDSTRRYLWN